MAHRSRQGGEQSASRSFLRLLASIMIAAAALIGLVPAPAAAQDYGLEGKARYALRSLTATVPLARMLEQRAYAILVFPDVTKAGFLIGGEYGNGVFFRRGGVAGYCTRLGFPMDCKRARRRSATRCIS